MADIEFTQEEEQLLERSKRKPTPSDYETKDYSWTPAEPTSKPDLDTAIQMDELRREVAEGKKAQKSQAKLVGKVQAPLRQVGGWATTNIKSHIRGTDEWRNAQIMKNVRLEEQRKHKLEEMRAGAEFWGGQGGIAAKRSADTLNAIQTARLTTLGAMETQRREMASQPIRSQYAAPSSSQGNYFASLGLGFSSSSSPVQAQSSAIDYAMNQRLLGSMMGIGGSSQGGSASSIYSMVGGGFGAPARPVARPVYAGRPAYAGRPSRPFKRPFKKRAWTPNTPSKPWAKKKWTPPTGARKWTPNRKPWAAKKPWSSARKPWAGKKTWTKPAYKPRTFKKWGAKSKWTPSKSSWKKKSRWKQSWRR